MMSVSEIKREEEERERKRKAEERERKRKLREGRRQQAAALVKASGRRHVLKLPEVEVITGRKKSVIYSDPSFPKPVPTGERGSGSLSDEVDAWLEQRVAERDRPVRTRSLPLAAHQEALRADKTPSKQPRQRAPQLREGHG